jgi:hypothetical protein
MLLVNPKLLAGASLLIHPRAGMRGAMRFGSYAIITWIIYEQIWGAIKILDVIDGRELRIADDLAREAVAGVAGDGRYRHPVGLRDPICPGKPST